LERRWQLGDDGERLDGSHRADGIAAVLALSRSRRVRSGDHASTSGPTEGHQKGDGWRSGLGQPAPAPAERMASGASPMCMVGRNCDENALLTTASGSMT